MSAASVAPLTGTTSGRQHGLRPLTRRYVAVRGGTSRARRAVAMLEFALILPMFLLLLVFAFDMGHLVLMSGAMQDATFTAARTGAQLGGAGLSMPSGSKVCGDGECSQGEAWTSLQDTVAQIPTVRSLGVNNTLKMTIRQGAVCTQFGDDHVVIDSHFRVRLITPGLGALLAMVSTKNDAGAGLDEWPLTATAVARCEVVRQ